MIGSVTARTAIVCLMVISLVLAKPGSQHGLAQSEQVYLALGDSIPAGLLASLPKERGYPAVLQSLMQNHRAAGEASGPIDLINLAEPGETVESFITDGQMDEAIEQIDSIEAGNLRTVSLTLGGNNILSLWESTATERQSELDSFDSAFSDVVAELADSLSDHNADVVVTTYYDLTDGDPEIEGSNSWWLQQFNEVIEEHALEAGFQVVDIEALFRGNIDTFTWFPADIHPNNAGHVAIAQAIWQELAYDQEPPDVEITRPDSETVSSRVPTIHARISDDVGLDSVVLRVDDEDVRELIFIPALDRWVGIWDARGVPVSEATVSVVATDLAGNESSDSVTIRLPSR
jgi:lysophospholipase L1-like esterase